MIKKSKAGHRGYGWGGVRLLIFGEVLIDSSMPSEINTSGKLRPIAVEAILSGLALLVLFLGYAWGSDSPGIVIKKAWVTDQDGNKKDTFSAGESVRYYIKYKVSVDSGTTYKVIGRVGVDGVFTDSLRKAQKHQSETDEIDKIKIDGAIPNDAESGEASVTFRVKLKKEGELDVLSIHKTEDRITISGVSDTPTDTPNTDPDASESESDEQVIAAESSDEETAGSGETSDESADGSETPTASPETGGGGKSSTLFGVGGGFSPYSSGDVGVTGEESEETEENEEEEDLINRKQVVICRP